MTKAALTMHQKIIANGFKPSSKNISLAALGGISQSKMGKVSLQFLVELIVWF